jgi:FxsC-like protein
LDPWIEKLFDDLCGLVRDMAGLPPGMTAGYIDRDLHVGHEWPDSLVGALATCRVFVPLYSTRYFRSEHCGKEWFAFNLRRLNYRARDARPIETIVPALWIPFPVETLPEAAASVQYNFTSIGDAYAEYGFYGIMKVARWREAYEEAVYLLARQIVVAAEASPMVELGRGLDFETLAPAFGGASRTGPGDKPLRVTVVAPSRGELPDGRDSSYYGEDALGWNPYREASVRPLGDYAAELARILSYTPEMGDLSQRGTNLVGDEQTSGPEVLLVDPWAVLEPECRDVLQRFPSMDKPWVQVIVIWSQRDTQMQANAKQLRAAVDTALAQKFREVHNISMLAVRGVPSIESFGIVFPTVIAEASRHYR